MLIIIIIIEGLSLLQSIPPTTIHTNMLNSDNQDPRNWFLRDVTNQISNIRINLGIFIMLYVAALSLVLGVRVLGVRVLGF